MINRDNWGWAARLGMFIVSSEAVPEAECWAIAPPGVSIHAARVNATAPWAEWNNDAANDTVLLTDDLVRGARHFAGMRLNSVVIGHSSSSILGGPGWDQAVVVALRQLIAEPVHISTNGLDCLAALDACGVESPFIVFPPWFGDPVVEAGMRYFAAHGLLPAGSLRVDPGRQWRDVPASQMYPEGLGFEQDVESTYRQIRSACPPRADGVMIVGTGLRCVGIIEALERDLQRPVITANQASVWHCLRTAGVRSGPAGYGRLMTL